MADEPFSDPAVEAVFQAYPDALRRPLLRLRALIFEAARENACVGDLIETLKWGQPAYLPARPRIGTTIRLGALKDRPDAYALFVHCQTSLADTFRGLYGETLSVEGDRAIVFSARTEPPRDALKHCIALALTYHAVAGARRPRQAPPRAGCPAGPATPS
jgi:hypothetical protein